MKIRVIILVSVVAVGVLFYTLRPKSQTESPGATNQQRVQSPSSSPQVASKTFALEIRNGDLVVGESVIKVDQGGDVNIKVVSDVKDELHIHGYDKELILQANIPASVTFKADIAGRFEIELHSSEQAIAALEIQPKL